MTTRVRVLGDSGGRRQLVWFCVWAVVGVGLALAISALGLFTVPLALVGAVVLVVRHRAGRSALGVLVGTGVVSLWVAYVQRHGPGTVSWHTAASSGATQYLDPRPWLVAGVLLVGVGLAAFSRRRRLA